MLSWPMEPFGAVRLKTVRQRNKNRIPVFPFVELWSLRRSRRARHARLQSRALYCSPFHKDCYMSDGTHTISFRHGDHICLFYRDPDEQMAIATPFVQIGLLRGE